MELNKYIDHTLLKADATQAMIEKLCSEAHEFKFASVCVNTCYVPLAADILKDSEVKTCTVVGFPLGAMLAEAKVAETSLAIQNGADEIDMVLNISFLKDKKNNAVEEEIAAVKRAAGDRIVKVIFETCYLTDEEIVTACNLCVLAGADYVKTSTGFGTGGATYADVELMKKSVGDKAKVKASGGVRDRESALKYIEIGAERLGTSSGIAIVKGENAGEGAY
jgi:deoxyribose-phosphate aldolase